MGEKGFIFVSCEAYCLFIPSEESPSSHGNWGTVIKEQGSCAAQ